MSDQGEADGPRPADAPPAGYRTGRDEDTRDDAWWSRLYAPDAPDTGGSGAGDTIDDRFASARAVGVSAPGRADADEPGLVDAAPPSSDARATPSEADDDRVAPPAGSAGPVEGGDPVEDTNPEKDANPVEDVTPERDAAASPGAAVAPDAAAADLPVGEAPGDARSGRRSASGPGTPPAPRPPARSRRRGVRGAFAPTARAPGAPTVPRGLLAPPEPGVLAPADPGALSDLVPDTVLDGARHEALVLRAVSARGGSARQRGEARGDALLTACFGTGRDALLFAAVATGSPPVHEGGTTGAGAAAPVAPGRRAAREVCQTIGEAVGRSRARLLEDIVTDRRATLSSGLKRLTDRCYGRMRAQAAALSLVPDAYSADLRCLLLPVDPDCRTRVVFGAGGGGLFRLRDGEWSDLEPVAEDCAPPPTHRAPGRLPDPRAPSGGPDGVGDDDCPERETETGARSAPPPFRFRAVTTEPGDTLLLCSAGLAVPLRGDPAFADTLAGRWAGGGEPPSPSTFLTDVQEPAPAYGDDRTAVAVWHTPAP